MLERFCSRKSTTRVRFRMISADRLRLTAHRSQFGTHRKHFGTHRSVLNAVCLLLIAHCSLLTIFAGNSWARQASGTMAWFHAVFFLDQNRGWAAGSKGAFLI